MILKKIFESKWVALSLLLIGTLFFLLFVFNFEPRIDDAFLGEQLYWLLNGGHVRSNLMSGFRDIGIENLWTVFHKGVIYNGYIWAKLFGWSIYTLHLSTLFFSCLYIFLLWVYFRDKNNQFSQYSFYLVIAVSFLFYYFTWNSTRFRPEIIELFFGFFAYYHISKYLEDGKNYRWIIAACSAGLAMLTHLNGLIVIAAGTILLLFNRKIIVSVLFGAVASIVFISTYFIDVFVNTDFQYFLLQFKNDPALNSSHFHWYSPFMKVPKEFIRYFHADVNTVFAAPFFLVLIARFKYLWKSSRNMVVYMLTMMIVLSLYTYNNKAIFMLPIFPYMAILMLKGSADIVNKTKKSIIEKAAAIAVLLFFPVSVYLMGVKIKTIYSMHYIKQNVEIGEIIGKNNRVMSDEMFIFHEIKNQSFILNDAQFTFFRTFHGFKEYSFEENIEVAVKNKLDFIIFRGDQYNKFKVLFRIPDNRYELSRFTDNYAILKIKN